MEDELPLYVKLLSPNAKPPTKAYDTDMGWDLYCSEDIDVRWGEVAQIKTDVAIKLPEGFGAVIEDRSGRAKQGLTKLGGVIDQYTGEWVVMMTCLNYGKMVHFNAGDKIAQFILHRVIPGRVYLVENLPETERGANGFGSSDKQMA